MHSHRAFIVAVLLALPLSAVAQAAESNSIHVSATGQFKADPDTATVGFVISGQDSKLKAAYAAAQAQADKVRALLKDQGFAPQDARLSSYSIQPWLDDKGRRTEGYTVTAELSLEIGDFSRIAPLVDAAGTEGLPSIRDIEFSLKNVEAAKTQAVVDGYGRARHEADALAEAAGQHVQALDSATVDVSLVTPVRRVMEFSAMAGNAQLQAAPTAGFTPNQITITANVTVVFRLAP